MPNLFATAFSSVYSQETPANQYLHQCFDGEKNNIIIDQQAVINAAAKVRIPGNNNTQMNRSEVRFQRSFKNLARGSGNNILRTYTNSQNQILGERR
ncbi:hypothetical protein E2C01_059142 [Portunus trituberculatus]|uniref:Uncharacterized protein n=1 Tax=Portunus trituberculatus TaxID=210409 RepID=A0A5B7H5A4_PORTR|nr:hypothetical protein [Portunus trituberculatus]